MNHHIKKLTHTSAEVPFALQSHSDPKKGVEFN